MNITMYETFDIARRDYILNQFKEKVESQKDLTLTEKRFLLQAARKFSHISKLQKRYSKIYRNLVRKGYIKVDKDATTIHKLVPTRIAPFSKYKEHNTVKLKERNNQRNERFNEING